MLKGRTDSIGPALERRLLSVETWQLVTPAPRRNDHQYR